MSENKEFQRDSSLVMPLLAYAMAAVLGLNGIAHLSDRHWLWAAVNLVVATAALVDLRWSRRTPIVTVHDGVLVIHRHLLSRPRRIRVDTITAVDDARPTMARLLLQGGSTVSIPLHWFAWSDRAQFLAYLRSVVGPGTP